MTPGDERARNKWVSMVLVIMVIACLLLLGSVSGIVIWRIRSSASASPDGRGGGGWESSENCSQFIHTACSRTFHPELCVSTLVTYPGVDELVEPKELARATIEATIAQVLQSYHLNVAAPVHVWGDEGVAQQECVELLHDTIYHLNATLVHMKAMSNKKNPLSVSLFIADVKTWLSAALTNQDTCVEGFQNLIGGKAAHSFATDIQKEAKKFSQLISNSLALFQTSFQNNALPGEHTNKSAVTQNPRRMLAKDNAGLDQEFYQHYGLLGGYDMNEFPMWLSATDRLLLQLSPADLKPDAVVAQDGSGNYVSITDAVQKAPSHLRGRKYIIYVKAGVYGETVRISKRKTNIMFVGDGKGKTVVVSSKNAKEGSTAFSSATFAASGAGFVARDMTFMNNAGPDKHQAVALRVGADFAAIYHCSIVGYQDTLYIHSLRQFYRECDIFGTIDFIFKLCNIYARQSMPNQKNTITAQGRNDLNQNTGISIQNCIVTAANDVPPLMEFYSTYLGRTWKLYSRTIYMQSFLGDLVDPAGWLERSGEVALKSSCCGEYMNTGPGAILDERVTWPGYRVIETDEEAKQYSVAIFISGSAVGSFI